MAQLRQSREWCGIEHRLVELNTFKDRFQLRCSPLGTPLTFKARHAFFDLCEGHAITPIVWTARTICHLAPGKRPVDDVCDVAHGVILSFRPDVESFAAYSISRSLERAKDRLTDIVDMNQRTTGRAVTHHADLARGESKAG